MSLVAIDRVNIHSNRRPLNDQKVAELMQSIKNNGLLNPITIDQNFNLLAGLHRLTACKLLGFEHVECRVLPCEDIDHARLAEIDENLIRNELEALERAELWLERDKILERIGQRAMSGENQYTKKGGELGSSPPSKTTQQLAQETGYNKRTYQLGKQIAKNIDPEVKEVIKKTPVAKSHSSLLKIARAGSKEREQAEEAEQKAQEAKAKKRQEELRKQAELAAQARAKQKELQLSVLQSISAEKEAKSVKSHKLQPMEKAISALAVPEVKLGDEWMLEKHLVFCGNTAEDRFIQLLPSNAALAIANLTTNLTPRWEHDYLIKEAHVVAVLAREGHIQYFCTHHQMPFRYEWILDGLYIGVYSYKPLVKPEKPIGIEGVEGIVAYLISLYTKHDNFVIAPFLGNAEVLITCERMGRICFAGDDNLEHVDRAIERWQRWTRLEARKEKPSQWGT